jgi:uncharacterized repeat protein (TIGR01451 family)
MQNRRLSKTALAIVSSMMSINIAQAAINTYAPTSITSDGVATALPAALTDNGCGGGNGVTVTFNVPVNYTVTDVDIGVNITHTWRGDLFMSLSSPTVAAETLFNRIHGNVDDFSVLFDSDAGAVIPTTVHTIPGAGYQNTSTPENAAALDVFNNVTSNGNWVFFVCDGAGQDTGTLDSIELFLTDNGPIFTLDVVKSAPTITTDVAPIGQVSQGDVLEYTIVATNTGTGTQTDVIVSDTPLTPNSNTCASVAPNGTCTLTGTYTVSAADRNAGNISNTGAAISDQATSVNSNTVNTTVVDPPQLSVFKENSSYIDNDVNGYISVGDVLNYTVTATNTSGFNADILVEDPIIIPSSNSCLNVLPNATCVLSGTYQVLAVDKLAGNILNTATATISGGSPIESNTVQVVVGEDPVAEAESVFYMPLPEADALDAFESIFYDPNNGASPISGETCGGSTVPANPISTYSSITILRSNTIIYYDHYEDGYEAAPNASAQITTDVWGDGDILNGSAPGNNCVVDSCDVLQAGTIIVLDSQIDTTDLIVVPEDPNDPYKFNGGDKISATDTISMTKANWSTGPDTLLAGAFELYPTTEWGTDYEIPVGQNVSPGLNNAKYQYVGITIMARSDGTTVGFDADGDGTDELSFILNEGESRYLDANDASITSISVGAIVTASDNVQVDIVTGDICANYEARFFTLFPSDLWDNSYYNPVGTDAADNAPVRTLLYNPDPVNPITVLVLDSIGNTTVNVGAGGFVDHLQNSGTAARYCIANSPNDGECNPDGGNFYAIAAVDADADSAGGQTALREDWGLTLVPTSSLSQQALVGLGFGQDPLITPQSENSSPVWVTADLIEGTPTDGIELCVDYGNDGTDAGTGGPFTDPVTGQEYDLRTTVDPYESLILRDPGGDQTSLLVWVCEYNVNTGNQATDDGNQLDARNAVIAAAWGQEPGFSGGAPAVDVGTGIPNVSSIILLKEGELTNDLNGDGFPSIGDTILYKISLTNIGFVPVSPGSVLTDTLPPNVDYVLNSTNYFNSFTSTAIADDSVPPAATAFPLDEAGISLQDLLAVGNSFLVTFEVTIASLPLADEEICNNADINVPFESVSSEFCIDIVPRNAAIGDFVWNDVNNNGIQDGGEAGIDGVTVTLVDIAGNPVLNGLGFPFTTTTAGGGAWSLIDLPIGDYRVLFDTSTAGGGPYVLTSPNQGGDDTVDSDGLSNGTAGESLTSIFSLAENETNNDIDAGFIVTTITANPEFCYAVNNDSDNGGDRLLTVDPVSGETTDLGAINPATASRVQSIAWDIGDPLVNGDETLFAIHQSLTPDVELYRLIPVPSLVGDFNTYSGTGNGAGATGIIDANGLAVDWQSTSPVYYGSAQVGANHQRIFTFDPTNAEVINMTLADISLESGNSTIDDIAWDPLSRRMVAVTNNGSTGSRIEEIDLSSFPATTTVHDCGQIVYDHDGLPGTAPILLEDTEGLTYSRPGELYISTGDNGSSPANDVNGLYKVTVDNIPSDCSAIVGAAPDILAVRVGPVNTFANVTGAGVTGDPEALDCGITFIDSNASIGNRVWLDEDADGLQSAGEDGIGNVTVYLCRAETPNCDSLTAIRTELTDANGGYLFTDIPLMEYIVAVDTSTLPANLASNPTYDEDNGTTNPDNATEVILDRFEDEHLTADFGYNWNESPETENPPPGTNGSIGDRIWSDTNGDGIQNSDEIGLNTVDVLLYDDPENDGVFDHFIGSTTTDDNGNYVFDGLPAGAYIITVVPGSLPAGVTWTQTGDPDNFGQVASNPDNTTTSPIILAPGDVYVNADFGYQGDNVNTHSIGNTVYLDANANGTNVGDGEPGIANVTISLLDSVGNTIAQTVTDSDGQYLFSGLPDGDYTVLVTDNNNVLAEKVQSGDPDATLDNRSNVTLSGADNLVQDFGYTPEGQTATTGLIGDTVYLDIDGDGNQSSDEPGIEGVRIELISAANGGFPIAETFTDENGNYSFGNLAADDYTVRIFTNTLPNGGTGLIVTDDPDNGTAHEAEVTIVAGEINLIQDFGYTVDVPNSISGTLWNDSDADGTQDGPENVLFEGVTINLLDPNGNIVGSTTTDANGDYSFTGLPDGTYTILVTDDGNVLAGHWLTDGTSDGSDLNSQAVDYTVSVSAGANDVTGDFGYYVNLASIGNVIYRDDNNDGIRDPASEPGITNVPVTLTISYPNSDIISLTVFTDTFGNYSFNNLLADDSYTGDVNDNPNQPIYSLAVGSLGSGFVSSYKGIADTTGIGNGIDDNSDNNLGEIAFPIKGGSDFTNDFGFTPSAVIGDRVWLDLDSDGIQDANEDGIANIEVQLLPPAGVDLGNGAGVAITTITDSEGKYIFPNIPVISGNIPGSTDYVVTVNNPPNGLTQSYDEDDGPLLIPTPIVAATPHSTSVNLTSGNEEYLTADFGYAPTSGSIGDYIWSDSNGDGQQDTFEIGIPGVTVELFNLTDNVLVTTTTTDITGHYLFTAADGVLLDKAYDVRVTAGIPGTYVQTGDPDGGTPDNETIVPPLNTSAGINLDADFGYQPPVTGHWAIGESVYIDLDNSSAQNGTEPGVPGITVHLLIDTNADNIPDTAIASMETDSNGNYLFPSLPEGENYGIVVTDTNNILNNYTQTDDPDVFFDGRSTVLNLMDNNTDQNFGFIPNNDNTGVIGDTIFNNLNGDNIQQPGESGFEGVRVNLFTAGMLLDSVLTDENGEYLFTGLDPTNTYSVIVDESTLPNNGIGWANNFDPDGGLDSTSSVTLTTLASVNLIQDFGYIASDDNSLGGTVWQDDDSDGFLDEVDNGIPNVKVVLRDSNGNIVASLLTDSDGDYLFTGLADGDYYVEVADITNELANLIHTDGPNAGDNLIDNNSQDDTGYLVTFDNLTSNVNTTADFGYAPVVTTPITLASFKAVYNQSTGETVINWSTLTETGNIGFDLYYQTAGTWVKANDVIIESKTVYSTTLVNYQLAFNVGNAKEWAIVDIDIMGKRETNGIFNVNTLYGVEEQEETLDSSVLFWDSIQRQHHSKKEQRDQQKAFDINDYIRSMQNKSNSLKGEDS